jgi:hypothetical protein
MTPGTRVLCMGGMNPERAQHVRDRFTTRGHYQGLDSPRTRRSARPGPVEIPLTRVRGCPSVYSGMHCRISLPAFVRDEAMFSPARPGPARPGRASPRRFWPCLLAKPGKSGTFPSTGSPGIALSIASPNQSSTGKGGGNPLTTHSPDWTYPLITDCIPPIQGGGNAGNPCHPIRSSNTPARHYISRHHASGCIDS